MKANLLIVDDDRLLLEQCVDMLMDVNAEIFLATTGKEAIEIIEEKDIDILVLDLVLTDTSGEEVMDRAKKRRPGVDVIIVSGFATVESVINLMRKGIFDYMKKPLIPEEFKFTVMKCMREREIIEENKKLKEYLALYELGKMLTSTLDLSKVYDNILILFENFIKNCAVVVYNADITKECDMKGFSGFERASMIDAKDALMDYINNPRLEKAEERIESNIYIYDTRDLSLFSNTGFEKVIILPIENAEKSSGFVFVFADAITEEKKECLNFVKEQIGLAVDNSLRYLNAQEMAYMDELTKVYNIRYLYVALENELKRAERFGTFISILFLDLDYFKKVNDTHGHLVGSRLLIEIASEIKKSVRGIDIVIRYGGDEFVVICTETDTDLALKVAERIRRRIEEREFFKEDGHPVKITASIGIATYPVHGEMKSELIDLADKAMYRGKELSRNVVCMTDKVAKK